MSDLLNVWRDATLAAELAERLAKVAEGLSQEADAGAAAAEESPPLPSRWPPPQARPPRSPEQLSNVRGTWLPGITGNRVTPTSAGRTHASAKPEPRATDRMDRGRRAQPLPRGRPLAASLAGVQ